MKILKIALVVILILAVAGCAVSAAAFWNINSQTAQILDDYSGIYHDSKYLEAKEITGVAIIKQKVSCRYAVLEMLAGWEGKNITEASLYEMYGKVTTSTGKAFCDEMNKQFPAYKTTMHKYMNSSEMLSCIYQSLSNGVPVPFEWAAKQDDTWTLHYSIVIGMDVENDVMKVANPYGYIEEITLKEFVQRTSFEAYEDMSLFLKYGFALGIFEKNAIFIMEKR